MFKRKVAFAMQRCLNDEGRGGGALDVSLDNPGMNLIRATLSNASMTASLHAYERLGHYPCALRWMSTYSCSCAYGNSGHGCTCAAPPPSLNLTGPRCTVDP